MPKSSEFESHLVQDATAVLRPCRGAQFLLMLTGGYAAARSTTG